MNHSIDVRSVSTATPQCGRTATLHSRAPALALLLSLRGLLVKSTSSQLNAPLRRVLLTTFRYRAPALALLLLTLTGLLTACGSSSQAISVLTPVTPQLQSISVGPPDATLAAGLTEQYAATGIYSDGSKVDISASVTWSSTVPSVATISNAPGTAGLATGVAVGTTTIAATFGGLSGTTPLTVTGATLVSIGVTPATPSVATGSQIQFTATGVYSDNTKQNLTTAVTWASATPSVATIGTTGAGGGLANARSPGTTAIAATLGNVTGSTTLTVTPVTLVSITVTPTSPSIVAGTTQPLTATGLYSDNTTQNLTTTAAWTSSIPAVATVSNAAGSQGIVSGKAGGAVTISASFGGVTGATTVTVEAVALVSITIAPLDASIAKGSHEPFSATGTYNNGSTQNITDTAIWSSSAAAVATISNAAGFNGNATAQGLGTATITATAGTVSASTTLTVTPATLVSIAVTPANAIIGVGSTEQYTATGTYSDGTTQVLTTATWSSATLATATISNAAGTNGLATAAALGTTQITAAVGAVVSPPVTLTVAGAVAYSVNIANSGMGEGSTVTQFSIAPDGTPAPGTLTELPAPNPLPTGPNPYSLAVDPANQHLYVANYNKPGTAAGSVSEFSIGASGALTPIATISTANGPNSIVVHPKGPYVYVADQNSSLISQYDIVADGVLTPMAMPTVAAGALNNCCGPASIAVNPAGTYAYAVSHNTSSLIYQYTISPVDGSLTQINTPQVLAGQESNWIAVDPSGRYVYVANEGENFGGIAVDSTISQYIIGPGGVLMPMVNPTVPAGPDPVSITIDAKGKNAYVANQNLQNAGTVWQFTIGPGGALTFASSTPVGNGPSSVAIDPTGSFAYVTNRYSTTGTISQFSIDPATGTLTPLVPGFVTSGPQPAAIITAY